MWRWDQSAGELWKDGTFVSNGYSGRSRGVNNPALQDRSSIGPIPRGRWRLTEVRDSPNTGPFSIVLEPAPGTDPLGRTAFRIHGDNRLGNQSASQGCIILPRAIRERIWASKDHDLEGVK